MEIAEIFLTNQISRCQKYGFWNDVKGRILGACMCLAINVVTGEPVQILPIGAMLQCVVHGPTYAPLNHICPPANPYMYVLFIAPNLVHALAVAPKIRRTYPVEVHTKEQG